MTDNKKLKQLKTSVFQRSMSLAKLGLNAGFQYAGSKIKNTPIEDFINSQAAQVTKELGELKGSIMKAGQMLSVYGEHFLPPEANKLLKTLQSDSPVIDWPVMHSYLKNSLDQELLAELDIDPEAVGSASMGQVHAATIRSTGEKIALKIQYPDVDKAIESDVAALKRILSLSKLLPSGLDTTEIFDEIKLMLHRELNYELEADLTEEYAQLISGDKRYKVPRVYRRYSNKKVLATEFIEGIKADHNLVKNLPQNRRNRLSENFLDLYLHELFVTGLIQTDPHLGNYKIQLDSYGQDTIVLLDFGAAKNYRKDSLTFLTNYRNMIKASVTQDEKLFMEATQNLGFIRPNDDPAYVKQFVNFCYETVEPFLEPHDKRNTSGRVLSDGTYDWKQNDLPDRVVKNAIRFKNFELRSPPRDILFLDRKTAGVFMFLNVLGAQINARRIIDPYLKQLS